MTKRTTPLTAIAAVLALGGALCVAQPGSAAAQSSRDMSVLSEQQRAEFTERLQGATSSAERARITAELNRAIQVRKMELRRQQREQNAGQGGAKAAPKGNR